MTTEVKGSSFTQLLEGPAGIMTATLFLKAIIREATIRNIYQFSWMDPTTLAIMNGTVDSNKVVKADRVAIAAEIVAEQRMQYVI